MLFPASDLDAIGLLLVSGGAALMGLGFLLVRHSPRCQRTLTIFAIVPPIFAVCALFWDELASLLTPLLLLAIVSLGCRILSSSLLGRFVAILACARSPAVQGTILLVVSVLFALGWSWHAEQQLAGEAIDPFRDCSSARSRENNDRFAWTDRGGVIRLIVTDHFAQPAEDLAERNLLHAQGLELHVIRTAPPDSGSNCHGWIFTSGRYLLDADDVERILRENGYSAIPVPQPGDLAVYRYETGGIAHTALVRVVLDGGRTLLEGKWARLGVYLHAPEDYHFAASWAYYRSPRIGHLLLGLDDLQESETYKPPTPVMNTDSSANPRKKQPHWQE